jgi:cobalt transporter subunit CbtB
MDRIFERDVLLGTLLPAAIVAGLAFALVVIAFGMESVASGVHDLFHDFRHVIGMPCH